jgi:hypothetical protein
MSNSFILRPGQTVTVDFGAEPTPADFARLIAILELQRALAAGEPIEFDIDVKARPSSTEAACTFCGIRGHKADDHPPRDFYGDSAQGWIEKTINAQRCSRCQRFAIHPIHRAKDGHAFVPREQPEQTFSRDICTCPGAEYGRPGHHYSNCPLYRPPAPEPDRLVPRTDDHRLPPADAMLICKECSKPHGQLHDESCSIRIGRILGLVGTHDCLHHPLCRCDDCIPF